VYGVQRVRRWWRAQVPEAGPFRVMALGVFVTTAGEGAWYTSWAIYFTTVVGLRPVNVGVALLIAGAVGFAGAAPLGSLADRVNPRTVLFALVVVDGLSMAGYAVVRSFWSLLAVAVVNTVADRASGGVKTTYVAGLAGRRSRVGELARQRVASHVGYTVGAAFGALCLSIDTTLAFTLLIVVNAATSLCYAALITRLPPVPFASAGVRRRSGSLFRDPAYLAVVGATGVLSLCWGMVSTALPLWLRQDTRLPLALAAVVVIINSAGIAALQVTASRGCGDARSAGRRAGWSGAALAGACLVFAMTHNGAGAGAAVLVIVAAALHLSGELWFVAANWGLTLGLTPEGRTGRYQGAAAAAQAAAQMASPVVMTLLIGTWGQAGWFVLAGVFATFGTAVAPATRWAIRTRPVPRAA
jgi:Major Facilitator Superfamily